MKTINIAKDFSKTPGGRFAKMGPYSGEEFRNLLVEALRKNDAVKVVLDGTEGYGSSFLEEAFGGLVRLQTFSGADILHRVHIVADTLDYETYVIEAKRYIDEALLHSTIHPSDVRSQPS